MVREYSGGKAAFVSLRIFWLRQKVRCRASRPPDGGQMLGIEPTGLLRDSYSKKKCHPFGWHFN